MTELPRRAVARTTRLAALPLGYGVRSAIGLGKRLGGAPAEIVMTEVQQRTAEQLFRTLGELKGGAMKVGQAMSIFEAALPEELAAPYREQLTRLQDSAPPMPTITIRQILAEQLGPDWSQRLVKLDPVAAAAASIGQVHRGVWRDEEGVETEVAVKVQYPGAGEALRSDLRQLARLGRSIGPMLPGIDVRALVEELQRRTVEELDYTLEAAAQRVFAEAYDGDPDVAVPAVLAGSDKVLVTAWQDSAGSLASLIRDGSSEERQHYADRLVRFLFGAPGRTGMLHADPHPGNFRLVRNADGTPGRLGVLDFGAVARLPGRQLPDSVGRLVRLAADDRYDELLDLMRAEGWIRERTRLAAEQLRTYLGPFVEPASVDRFRFSRTWMQQQFRRIGDPRSEEYATSLRVNLPPSYLLIHRTWSGAIGVLSQLEVELPFRQLMAESVPGFADA